MRIQDLIIEHKDNMADFIAAMEDFIPLVMKELELESLPTIKLKKHIKDSEQPTFGKYVNDKHILYVGLKDRHIIDVLRTIAHELVHYKQDIENRLHLNAGETGSDIENEANKMAGIIMRKFNKAHRHYFEKPALDLMESKRKKKKRTKTRSPTFRGFYGYYGDFSDNSGGDAGGDVAESWSKKYKKSINCNNPKGFSQRAHCQGRKKKKTTESVSVAQVHKLADKKGIPWDNNKRFMRKTRELTGKRHLDDLTPEELQKVVDWLNTTNEGDLIPFPKGTVKVDVSDVYDWYKLGMHISDLEGLGKHDFGQGPPQTVMAFGSEPLEHKYLKNLNKLGLKTHDIDENFADGKKPGRKGLSKRVGIPKKTTLAQLKKIANTSTGERRRMAQWQLNMRRGRNKKK